MNTGTIAYDAATISTGGSHIHKSAKAKASCARRHPRIAPQIASAVRFGNAKVPVALLNRAIGAYKGGGFRHPTVLPAAFRADADCRAERNFGARISAPTASVAASAHACFDCGSSNGSLCRATTNASQT